ncbi:MAG: folate-binding protein YgfZ [Rhodobacterales bacterium]|nr:folate-binding protein YgfZ [Rhodobacterales bacterium]
MSAPLLIPLTGRGLLAVAGEDARPFLQGLISNDVNKVAPDRAVWSAFLTPQGKYLHDFFIAQVGDTLYLDMAADRLADLKKRLGLYRLRSKVTIEDASAAFRVAAVIGDGAAAALGLNAEAGAAAPIGDGVAFMDPRLAAMGARVLLPADDPLPDLAAGTLDDYEVLRLTLGLPDGDRDMVPDKALLLENGFEELHGVDWKKGCYMGQELTARTRYRGLVKKRLLPVDLDGPAPEAGTPILRDGKEVGEMRSSQGPRGLALLRLEALDGQGDGNAFTAGDTRLTPRRPDWVVLQSEAET